MNIFSKLRNKTVHSNCTELKAQRFAYFLFVTWTMPPRSIESLPRSLDKKKLFSPRLHDGDFKNYFSPSLVNIALDIWSIHEET